MFAEFGYPNASIGDLAAAVGVSKPTVYYHFGNKAGLFQAVLDRAQDRVFERFQDVVNDGLSWREKLVSLIETIFAFTHEETDLVRVTFYAAFTTRHELPAQVDHTKKGARNFSMFHGAIQEGQLAGDLAGHDSMELALGLWGQAVNHVMTYLLTHEVSLDRALAVRMVDLFVNGAHA